MKTITEKNAISILNSARPRKGSYDRLQIAFDMAIKALEKQIPKKVKNYELACDKYGSCPVCGIQYQISKEEVVDYCNECGQKLDWSAENE